MAKRRTGSIKRFGGGFRRWVEGKHPRDARGRFADVPDVYVPPRTLRTRPRHLGVDRWESLHIWDRPEMVPENFTQPSTGWSAGPNQRGFPLRADEGRPPWLRGDGSYIYYDPDLKMPVYIDQSNGGLSGIKLGPAWWDLTPEERRHALYFAAGSGIWLKDSGYADGIAQEPPLFGDVTSHMDLNGYTSAHDVAAEAYALLADGDGEWLEREYPGLAEVVRREAASLGLPIDDGPIADPVEGDDRFAYGREPLLPVEVDPDEVMTWEERHKATAAYEDEILAMVSRGDITVDDGAALISMPGADEAWHPLPENLWHVSTNAPSVIADGFKSRDQLGQRSGIGLGGGPSNVISFTSSIDVATNVYSAMLEARAFAAGEITMRDLLELDTADTWGAGPGAVTEAWTRSQVGDVVPGVLPERMAAALDAPPSDETWQIYRDWIRGRDTLGGPSDPLFFQTDWKGLGATDPADIAILEITPAENTFGQALGAAGLHEWRVHPAALPQEIDRAMRPAVSEDLLPRRTLYRGLEAGFHTPDDIAAIAENPEGWLADHKILERVGEHWSSDFNVASNFARMGGHEVFTDMADWLEDSEDPDATLHLGVVIQAAAPESGILVPGTAEWRDIAETEGIFDPTHPEAEVTVDRGANLRIEGIWLTVSDNAGNDQEFRIDLERLADLQPLDRVQAIRNPFNKPKVSGLPALLEVVHGDPARYNGLAEMLGLPVTSVSPESHSPERIREVAAQLDTEPVILAGLSWLGFFSTSAPEPDSRIAAAVALMHGDRFGVSADGNLTFTMPDGTVLKRDVGGVMSGQHPGVALAERIAPEMVQGSHPWRVNDRRMIQAALLNELDPDLRSSQAFAARYFGYDRNSRSLPMEHQHWDGRAAELLSEFLPTDTAADMGEIYDTLANTFPGVVLEDMLPMEGGWLETEMANRGVTAFVNSAGVAYFDPTEIEGLTPDAPLAVPTPEGIMAHEFGHRLFAGAVNDPRQMAVASFAFEQARFAAESELGAPIMTGITSLSAYANTQPVEGYAELFSAYWASTDDVPPWVTAWGRTFTSAYHAALSSDPATLPLSRDFVQLQGGDVMAVLSLDDFEPDLPRPGVELRSALQAQGVSFEIDSDRTRDLFASFAEDFIKAVGIEPHTLVNIEASVSERDRFAAVSWPADSSGPIELFALSTDRVTFPSTEHLTREVVEVGSMLFAERHLGERSDVRLSFEGPFAGPPPVEGMDEVRALFRAMTGARGADEIFIDVDGLPSSLYNYLKRRMDVGAIRTGEDLWEDPRVSEFFSTYEGLLTVNTHLDRDYLAQRRDAITAEMVLLAESFDPRDEPLSARREAKLQSVYGESFRTEVDNIQRWQSHPYLVHLPALAEEQGQDVEDYLNENGYIDEIYGHFAGWTHTAEIDGETWVFTADVSVDVSDDNITVDVDFMGENQDGYESVNAGNSKRTLNLSSGTVDHDLLALGETRFEGHGIGFAWNRHNDPWYMANGMDKVTVTAGMTEGGYAWASDFFTMTPSQRDSFFVSIKTAAQRVVSTADADTEPGDLVTALQALVDIKFYEDSGELPDGWELAHIGWHPSIAAERSWMARQVMRGKTWGGTKHLDRLVLEATGRKLDIPTAAGAPSMKDDWHPFWQDYTSPTMEEGLLSEWVETHAKGGGFEWLSENKLRAHGGGEVLIFGGDTPYVDATELTEHEAAEIYFALAAAAGRSGAFSDVTMRVNPGEGDRIATMIEQLLNDREGPPNFDVPMIAIDRSSPFGVPSEYVSLGTALSSNAMEQRIRGALIRDTPGRATLYGERGLANPKLSALSMPLTGTSSRWGDLDRPGTTHSYSDPAGRLQFTVNEVDGVRTVNFEPDSDLQPSDRVQILSTEATWGVTANAPRTVVARVPALIEITRFTGSGWTYFKPDEGAEGFIAHPLSFAVNTREEKIIPSWSRTPTMRLGTESDAPFMTLTNHVDADGNLYAVGKIEGGDGETRPDYDLLAFAAEQVATSAHALRNNPRWGQVVLDMGDRPAAAEVAAKLKVEMAGLLANAADDVFTWDDDGLLTINIQSMDTKPRWGVPMRVMTQHSTTANIERFAGVFRRWEQASHPGEPSVLDGSIAFLPVPVNSSMEFLRRAEAPMDKPSLLFTGTPPAGFLFRWEEGEVDPVDVDAMTNLAIRVERFMLDYNNATYQWNMRNDRGERPHPNLIKEGFFSQASFRFSTAADALRAKDDLRFRGITAYIGDDPTTVVIRAPRGVEAS